MKKLFSNKYSWIMTAAVVLVVLFLFSRGKHEKSDEIPLTGKVEKGELVQRSTVAGTVIPARKTIITAPYQGYIKKIFVQQGQIVKAGDPIASIAPTLVSSEDVFPLRSPFSGKVMQVNKSEGEFVKASDASDFIARVDDLSKIYVDAEAPELDRVKMKIGLEAIVKATAILDHDYKGIIRDMSYAAREMDRWGRSTSVEFPIRLEILNPDDMLAPGMSVLVDITTLKKENVLRLRHEFIGKNKENYFVTLSDGTVQNVVLGAQNEEYSEVLEGLKDGMTVRKVNFADLVKTE